MERYVKGEVRVSYVQKKQEVPSDIKCPFCGASNPPKAYCCITCFKVMKKKIKVPFWRVQIHPSLPFSLFMLGVIAFLIYFFVLWMRDIEAQVNMSVSSGDYSITVTADKKKQEVLPEVQTPPQE